MSDILTRLLLNTGDYDSKLAKAKKSSNDFASNIGGKAAAAVGKFAAGIGVAMGGVEAFDRVIKSSQTTGDKFAETIEGMKAGVNAFFESISTGDFSSFTDGLGTVITKAREAYQALDQLGNAQMSFNLAQSINQADIANAMRLAKNKFAPTDVRKGAFSDWAKGINTQEEQSKQLAKDIQNYVAKAVEKAAGVKGFSADIKNITDALLLDIKNEDTRKTLKDQYSQEYKEYLKAVKEATKKRNEESVGKGVAEKMHAERRYNEALESLAAQYNQAITVNALLVKYEDDQLKELGGYMKNMKQLDVATSNLKREYNETANEFNNANKGVKGFVPVESFEGYQVYSGGGSTGGGGGKTSAKQELPVYVDGLNYQNALGGKVLKWMNGEEVPVIKAKIEIEEEVVDEEDVAGMWDEEVQKKKEAIEEMNNALQATGDIFSSLGSIAGSFGNDFLAASLQGMSGIAQLITQLQALSTAEATASAAKVPFPGNIPAIATVVATIASVFGSLPKFADGGVVGGSSYFGDKLLARVNSGEMILNQQQQARALSLMDGGRDVRVSGDVKLNGKDIYIVLRNYLVSSGNKL